MAKKKDLKSLGEAYGTILDKVVVRENVPAGTIGNAPLLKGGPTERGGFKASDVDITKVGDKENTYNVKGLSYGDGNDPGTGCDEPLPTSDDVAARYGIVGKKEEDEEDETEEDDVNKVEADLGEDEEHKADKDYDGDGKVESRTAEYMGSKGKAIRKAKAGKVEEDEEGSTGTVDEDDLPDLDEEDEESSEEIEKIAEEGLNIFMKRKSVFDKLYDKVMVNEEFGSDNEEADLDALGLDDAETDADAEGEVTVTLDRETAQHLCDVLKAALGDEDGDDVDAEIEVEDEQFPTQFGEEDEEGEPTAMNTHYNDGKQNKVGSLKKAGGAASTGATGKVDAGSNMNTHYNDGKQNKVGNLKPGSSAFE
tara:strand:- start:27 stop:1124 length:1098 start_codon:yes stop_codon:yes gene_type:complete